MILITVCRTLFYQFLLLFVGISRRIINAEWVGWKYPIIQTSIQNTFFSINFEDEGYWSGFTIKDNLKYLHLMVILKTLK